MTQYHLLQPKLLLYDRWIANIKDHIIIVYIFANNGICFSDGIVALFGYIVRTWKDVIIKITFAHNGETNFIRNHPMRPEVFVCRWNITVKSEKRISNLLRVKTSESDHQMTPKREQKQNQNYGSKRFEFSYSNSFDIELERG